MTTPYLTASDYRLDTAIGFLHQRNARLMRALAEDAFSSGVELSFTQFLALVLIRDDIGSMPSALGRALAMTSGAVTRLVDWLEHGGYVRRHRCLSDRRSVKIELTAIGARTIERLLPRLIAMWNQVLEAFEPQEYDELVRLERKLWLALERAGRPAAGPG